MPHGPLTPLGKQLGLVLANIRPTCAVLPLSRRGSFAEGCRPSVEAPGRIASRGTYDRLQRNNDRRLHVSSRAESAAASAISPALLAIEEEGKKEYSAQIEYNTSSSACDSRRWKRRRRTSHLIEAFSDVGMQHALPCRHPRKIDRSHTQVKSREGRQLHDLNAERHAKDNLIPSAESTELSLERLTASCIRHRTSYRGPDSPTGCPSVWLSERELAYLRDKGRDFTELQKWADILSASDPYAAATMLCSENRAGEHRVPSFVLLSLLRRSHINARALGVLIAQSWSTLEHRKVTGSAPREATVFTLFVRLLRHAREVWPAAIMSITELLLEYLSNTRSRKIPTRHYEGMTYMMNKAMHLISLSTAVEPYKDAVHRQLAAVRILRFMAEHTPSLQINREGYRAVIRIQLAQEKTPEERQWAELKALSWPPWKQERTAMDAFVTHDSHGVSRAAHTLRQMREAGYHPLEWETAAQLYAGWDLDGTPSVQKRTVMGTGRLYSQGPAVWVARISTTRTVQEAWAAYLAYEDAKLEHNDAVCFAVFEKLYGEEHRRRMEELSKKTGLPDRHTTKRHGVLSGDAREVEPLPPSTHLYTYTRSEPPTVEGFFRHLSERGLPLSNRCLAFIAQNATSLQLGLEYLRYAIPSTAHEDSQEEGHTATPKQGSHFLLEAYIGLLCRYTNVPLTKVDHHGLHDRSFFPPALAMDNLRLNYYHPLVRAMSILDAQKPSYRRIWNLVIQALSRDATLSSMRFLAADYHKSLDVDEAGEDSRNRGALLAYRLIRRLLHMLREAHVDLDIIGFHSLCIAVEKMSIACWKILKHDLRESPKRFMDSTGRTGPMHDANALLRSSHHVRRLKGLFGVLTTGGEASSTKSGPGDLESQATPAIDHANHLPQLLVTPSPALLHAYIRALGWMADYDGLLDTVKWMVKHRTELAEQQARERNGDHIMRLTIVALRVFLERQWLQGPGMADHNQDELHESVKRSDPRRRSLRRLETAAPSDLVVQVQDLIEGVAEWRGWPIEREVGVYTQHIRFVQIQEMYQM